MPQRLSREMSALVTLNMLAKPHMHLQLVSNPHREGDRSYWADVARCLGVTPQQRARMRPLMASFLQRRAELQAEEAQLLRACQVGPKAVPRTGTPRIMPGCAAASQCSAGRTSPPCPADLPGCRCSTRS